MRPVLKYALLIFVLGFLALFSFRLVYGYAVFPNGEAIHSQSHLLGMFNLGGARPARQSSWSFGSGVKNYASTKVGQNSVAAKAGPVNQKYEKVARIGLQTKQFDEDEKRVRDIIKQKNALIQFERSRGLKGRRSLNLAIGVNPEDFEGFVEVVQTYGKLQELSVNKSDKTNEYRQLKAKRISLEKARDALVTLKQRDGEIKSMISLEQKILELEQQVQALGVSLGDFDQEHEFVTVKLRLNELGKGAVREVSLIERVHTAFVWAVKYWALLCLAFVAVLIGVVIAVHLLRLFVKLAVHAEQK